MNLVKVAVTYAADLSLLQIPRHHGKNHKEFNVIDFKVVVVAVYILYCSGSLSLLS